MFSTLPAVVLGTPEGPGEGRRAGGVRVHLVRNAGIPTRERKVAILLAAQGNVVVSRLLHVVADLDGVRLVHLGQVVCDVPGELPQKLRARRSTYPNEKFGTEVDSYE